MGNILFPNLTAGGWKFDFLNALLNMFYFHRGFILLMWAQMDIAVSGYLHPCCFSLLILPFTPVSLFSFFIFLDYCLNYPKNTFPIIRTFTAVKASYPKTLTIASFRLGLLYLFCAMRGVRLARV